MHDGRIIAEGTPEQLKAYLPQGGAQFTFESPEMLEQATSALKDFKIYIAQDEYRVTAFTDKKADTLSKIFHTLYANGIPIQEFAELTPTLEDVFLSIIAKKEENSNEREY